MGRRVRCTCGVEIDVSGETPRIGGTNVYCVVCGTVSKHEL